MDPWVSKSDTQTRSQVGDLDTTTCPNIGEKTFFQDNFQPGATPNQFGQASSFLKLPDSQEYLASLENKLQRIQKGAESKGGTASSILHSLSQSKESCMLTLLTNNTDLDKEEFLSEEVKVNLLLKKVAPEKQAISTEELIHLLKADQLQVTLSEQEENPAAVVEVIITENKE